ncbi:MAG: NADH-quinone oxidoreductase subunit A [Candidatus Nezhaarchaeota archaeon]|nr:NADH-quinone oxidoreductase subunit A [Candidatus Nezhaarchaeota archaeon]MCX8142223.1 NADH-quinone oxidoreductase subunit A [Candidatus Nezhaarchaeota archaeon]MDW8050804.1 NADH-quinone oxidoreductase subunit A [Nitrososphaerota archaeon]
MSSAIAIPMISFIIALVVSALIYAWGSKIAPKPKSNPEKVKPYACGEDVPAEVAPFTIRLINFVVLFLVFDIVSLVVAFAIISPGMPLQSSILIMIYVLIVLEAILLLARRRW